MSAPARLHPADVEAIAEATAHKLAALLHEGAAPAHTGLLTAAQVAQRFGVTPV